jgi:hypothetical protein
MAWPRNEPDHIPVDMEEWAEQFMAAMGTGTDIAKAIKRVREETPVLYLALVARVTRDHDC